MGRKGIVLIIRNWNTFSECDYYCDKLRIFTVIEQETGLRHGMCCRWQPWNRECVGSAAESASEQRAYCNNKVNMFIIVTKTAACEIGELHAR